MGQMKPERLKELREGKGLWSRPFPREVIELVDRLVRAEAQAKRFREALEQIEDLDGFRAERAHEIAMAALDTEEPTNA